jgi:hypothetical protein
VTETPDNAPRRLRLRYPAVCGTCGLALSVGTEALWDREQKQATCLACAPGASEIPAGTPGASAAAEGTRRKEKRVEEVRRRYGDHAAVVAEAMAEREISASWGKGSTGESKLASFIDREVGNAVIPLHDRLIPGTRGNIDHIWIAPTGIWVVDAKAYKGKVVQRQGGPFWRRDNQLFVGRHNRTALAAGVQKQVDAVLAAVKGDPAIKGTDVYAGLCFLDSEWGLTDFPFQVGAVWILYPGALRKRLKKKGPLTREAMGHIARRLDLSLPIAGEEPPSGSRRSRKPT